MLHAWPGKGVYASKMSEMPMQCLCKSILKVLEQPRPSSNGIMLIKLESALSACVPLLPLLLPSFHLLVPSPAPFVALLSPFGAFSCPFCCPPFTFWCPLLPLLLPFFHLLVPTPCLLVP